jgi:hypothetical protein
MSMSGAERTCLGDCDLQVVGTDLDSAQWYEGEVTADEAFLDGAELRLVGLDVNVDVNRLAGVLAAAIDEHLVVRVGDTPPGLVLVLGHVDLLVSSLSLCLFSHCVPRPQRTPGKGTLARSRMPSVAA